ncbi:MAG: hypothetical protein EOO36_00650 [Cytophagaceae bacterium]|nr:MAG: hypothetical protein EOO36_00650 [Cytophagaceae bacterium]
MNASTFLLAAALSLPALRAAAQTLVAGPDAPAPGGAYLTAAQPAAGPVTYFGVVNSQDARHAQFGQLRQVFDTLRPTLVVVEKPDLGGAETEAATIATKGVPGYTRLLAQQRQIPTERLDDPEAEYAYLRTKIEPAQLKLYYLLREARRFQLHTGADKALTIKHVRQLIAQSATFLPGTENTIRSVGELAAAYHHYCPGGGQWWDAPTAYFSPQAAVALYPSGSLAHTLGSAISAYRAQYVYGPLAARAQAGERILVVMSCDQQPAPTAATGEVAVK